ncbi:MAG: permease [Deltaproteobacteria bacterium]|uniref:Permease n=1 Tax=Candidatus Zymogenus saltonus TaxID=2844893 RepID=A0A9D8PQ76_9DELT|nr:permease [Candidatus Zymogenus saltonus]
MGPNEKYKIEGKILLLMLAVFFAFHFLPLGNARFDSAVMEALYLTKLYAREHVVMCLLPALFIAGAVTVFLSQNAVMKYLGAGAKKVVSYGVAAVSGSFLAVCSCTILPLFAGISRVGAGLGPATTFLYSGPAINILAIVLTMRVLGLEIGIARGVGAILFSVIIGLVMHFIYRREEAEKVKVQAAMPEPEVTRPLYKNGLFFLAMIGILVFANWGRPEEPTGVWGFIFFNKWAITGAFSVALSVVLVLWFGASWWKVAIAAVAVVVFAFALPDLPIISFSVGIVGLSAITGTGDAEARGWFSSTWDFTKQILPLLFAGVMIAGALLGRPGSEGLIPSSWIASAVGGNSLGANLFAAVSGAFMYFATLTEVPILQGLMGAGMGKGPALALLLSGPAVSLPNMLVIRSVMGTAKTLIYIILVIVMSTAAGMIYGTLF